MLEEMRYDTAMKHVTVFGANGRVGRLIVSGLLERGHTVTAFVHTAGDMKGTDQLRVLEGDIYEAESVEDAVAGADVVISALGSWGTPRKDILSTGMKHIIPAMQSHGVKRLISLTGAEARADGDHLSLIHRAAHFAASLLAGKILRDGESHIRQLEGSKLDWTVIRSPIMNESGSSHYVLKPKRPYPWQTINRQAVADAMVQQLNDSHFSSQSPFITR
jgi:putative NADH-flavin reductase